MFPSNEYGAGDTALVLMPFLGGSQREWTETVGLLSTTARCVTIDLPGFGAATEVAGYSVDEMSTSVIACLQSLALSRYILVGHSMAGKVCAVMTRRLIEDPSSAPPPIALVLVAPSPPSPEPMSEIKRQNMLDALSSDAPLRRGNYTASDRPAAEKYIRDNIAGPIPDAAFQRTVDDVLLMTPEAWAAWLTGGSKEDWSSFVATIDLPALIIAGTHDQALGPDAQRVHTLPHLSRATLTELDCSHLIPLEKPSELAALIAQFLADIATGGKL